MVTAPAKLMPAFFLCLAVVNLVVVAAFAVDRYLGQRTIRKLADLPLPPLDPAPKVSIIVAARNEERHLETALRSLLALEYDDFEIILVDDRSTDRTGEIADAIAQTDRRLTVLHLEDLPPGWLGKNHALHQGAQRANGQLLLFTDADVIMAPSTLPRAVAFLSEQPLDHLALAPSLDMPSWILEAFVVTFFVFFAGYARPWRARDPKSSRHIGIGAFNLVRAEAYRAAGGHARIAMRPDDDMKLGKIIKESGFRQDVVSADSSICVPWYGSVRELLIGLEKNMFAGVEYRVSVVAGATAAILAFDAWPFAAVFLPLGAARLVYMAVVLLLLAQAWNGAISMRARPSSALGFPLAALLFVYAAWRGVLLALVRRGVRWRDTQYPLAELKRNKV